MAPSFQTEGMLVTEANAEATGPSGAASSHSCYIQKNALPAVLDVNTANFEEIKKSDQVVVVAYLSPDDKRTKVIFASFVDKYQGQFVFGTSYDAALARKEGVDRPSVVVYKAFDERRAIYPNGREFDGLDNWFKITSKPLIGEIDEDTYLVYKEV
ncbi:protein disulfide-isomerase precursor [Aspergillus melleus]|uniref:protein disulfide-isomerase precursor n=1 Tax=Aspergillus melleus TaxID=138277 RepID=UPI001E8CDDAD|nr:protein disulfide-isomerase precursor [Aspergillus melleus]KAH8424228.1 protein disulfide-isomerase precursor [Aspergillus melleus]